MHPGAVGARRPRGPERHRSLQGLRALDLHLHRLPGDPARPGEQQPGGGPDQGSVRQRGLPGRRRRAQQGHQGRPDRPGQRRLRSLQHYVGPLRPRLDRRADLPGERQPARPAHPVPDQRVAGGPGRRRRCPDPSRGEEQRQGPERRGPRGGGHEYADHRRPEGQGQGGRQDLRRDRQDRRRDRRQRGPERRHHHPHQPPEPHHSAGRAAQHHRRAGDEVPEPGRGRA